MYIGLHYFTKVESIIFTSKFFIIKKYKTVTHRISKNDLGIKNIYENIYWHFHWYITVLLLNFILINKYLSN